tara:strand:- start:284 stop:625 length:342 start_codon:yes stop_codon:yes gene_type:complete
MKFSHGHELTAGSSNTILEAPSGYDAVVTYLFVSNIGGNSKSFAARWVHGAADIDFVAGKSVSAGDFLTFGGEAGAWVVLKEGDKINITPEASSTFASIISFELVPATTRLNF